MKARGALRARSSCVSSPGDFCAGLPAVVPERDSLRSPRKGTPCGRVNRPECKARRISSAGTVPETETWPRERPFALLRATGGLAFRLRVSGAALRMTLKGDVALKRRRCQGGATKETRPWSGSPEKEMSPGVALRNCLVILSAAKDLRSEASGLPSHPAGHRANGRPCSGIPVARQILRPATSATREPARVAGFSFLPSRPARQASADAPPPGPATGPPEAPKPAGWRASGIANAIASCR